MTRGRLVRCDHCGVAHICRSAANKSMQTITIDTHDGMTGLQFLVAAKRAWVHLHLTATGGIALRAALRCSMRRSTFMAWMREARVTTRDYRRG